MILCGNLISPLTTVCVSLCYVIYTVVDCFIIAWFLSFQRWMWSFYKGSPDTINFHNMWHGNQTYLDKVKVSF